MGHPTRRTVDHPIIGSNRAIARTARACQARSREHGQNYLIGAVDNPDCPAYIPDNEIGELVISNEFTRKFQVQHLWSIWIDNEDLVCVSQFWMDEHGNHHGHPEVVAMEAEYGSVYSVRLAKRGKPN